MREALDPWDAAALLRRCTRARDLASGRRLHLQISQNGLDRDTVVGNLLVQFYGQCGWVEEARRAFDHIGKRNVFSWNIFMTALAQNEQFIEARKVFNEMKERNEVSWTILLSSNAQGGNLDAAERAFRKMPMLSAFSCNAMVSANAQHGNLGEGWDLFASMPRRDVSCWNGVLKIFSKATRLAEAEEIYGRMPLWDVVSSTEMLTAFANSGKLSKAREIFDSMPEHSTISCNAMITGFANSRCIADAWNLFSEMPQRTASSWNLLVQMYARDARPDVAKFLFDRMPLHDEGSISSIVEALAGMGNLPAVDEIEQYSTNSCNAILQAYAQAGEIEQARELFRRMPDKDTVSWTTVLGTYAIDGRVEEARSLFEAMRGRDLVSWSALIGLYAQCGHTDSAREIFDQMPCWDVVSCNVMVLACSRTGGAEDLLCGEETFLSMPYRDQSSWTGIITAYARCGYLENARSILDKMPQQEPALWNVLLKGYTDTGCYEETKALFDALPEPNTVSWTVIIPAYAQTGHTLIGLLCRMDVEGAVVDGITYASFLDAFGRRGPLSKAEQDAAFSMIDGSDETIGAAAVAMFGRCNKLLEARLVFEEFSDPGTLLRTAMIAAYAQNGYTTRAVLCFRRMLLDGCRPDRVTLVAVVGVCSSHPGTAELAWSLARNELGVDETSDPVLGSLLVTMYGKWGRWGDAKRAFDRIPFRNAVTWTSMISAYARSGHTDRALAAFAEMDLEGVGADDVTYASVLQACSSFSFDRGKALHEELSSSAPWSSTKPPVLMTSLISMYGRCGSAWDAKAAFDVTAATSTISWTAVVSAYAQNGHMEDAIRSLQEMQQEGVNPEAVTMLSVLSACSHSGVVSKGREHFLSMQGDHWIEPNLEHYVCIVDLLCRAGNLEQAEELLETMPFEPQLLGWMSLLAACKSYGHIERGHRAAERVVELDHAGKKSSAYILLSSIRAGTG